MHPKVPRDKHELYPAPCAWPDGVECAECGKDAAGFAMMDEEKQLGIYICRACLTEMIKPAVSIKGFTV